jgi:prepilin-type N-terminal cleavage/methylation domain-containing protein
MTRGRDRGFTLIELMIALVVSSLLVGLILAIFSRMSISYRGQQQIAGVQQVIAAARATIELDAKQAGFEISQGFTIAGDATPKTIHPPVEIIDSATGPDQIALFYADPSAQAVVTAVGAPDWISTSAVTVDSVTGFTVGGLVVMVNVNPAGLAGLGAADPTIATFDACVLQIASIAGTNLTFATTGAWGRPSSPQCTAPTLNTTMIYNFIAHAYRIDTSIDPTIPTTSDLYPSARGTLQMSPTGGLLNSAADNWSDLAYGFTDLQAAVRFYDGDLTDQDGDADATRDWYSGPAGAALTAPQPPSPPLPLPALQMSISLVAKTDREIEGISTSQTPALIGAPTDYNSIGNHPSVALPAQAPWAADPLLKGARVYRYVTFQVDLRNIGVGR